MVSAGWRSSLLVLILVFGLLFTLLYFTSTEKTNQGLTVKTDKPSYNPGDTATISGTVSNNILQDPGLPIIIQIYNPEGNLHRVDQVSLTGSGSYSYEVMTGGSFGNIQGEYRVVVAYTEHVAETKFDLKAE